MTPAECRTQGGDHLNLVGITGQGLVQGRMLEMTWTQTFRNPENVNVEVVYTFPLPYGAVLLGIEAVLNGQSLTGVVTAKAAARETYEVAISEGHTSILMSKNHDGSYTLELGNLLANEKCTITLKYAQVLQPEQGSLRLMLPCTIAPRYGNAITQGQFEPHAAPVTSLTAEYPFDIRLTIKGSLAEANIASPSHAISVKSRQGEVDVQLGANSWLDRDFVLVLSELTDLSSGLIDLDSLSDGDRVVMASLSPTFGMPSSNPTCLKILVDCSGSMAGDSIEAAKRSLQAIVNSLTSEDWFTLSKFGDKVRHRSDTPWAGGAAARASAMRWVDGLKADMGGTEMNSALEGVMSLKHSRPSDVLLITDGEVYAIDDILATAKSSGHRMFVVGIGSSPAEGLLRRLASDTGGSCEFVSAGESAGTAVLRMFNRMRGPSMADLRVVWKNAGEAELLNELPTAVFDSDTVTLFAKLSRAVATEFKVEVELLGRVRDAGSSYAVIAGTSFDNVEDERNTLARIAANALYHRLTEKAAAMSETTSVGDSNETQSAFETDAALIAERYQLVTDKTNFVMVQTRDTGLKPDEMPELRQVAGMTAAGWSGLGREGSEFDIAYSIGQPDHVVSMHDSSAISTPSVWRTNRCRVVSDDLDTLSYLPSFSRRQVGVVAQQIAQTESLNEELIGKDGRVNDVKAAPPLTELTRYLMNHPPGLWPTSFSSLQSTWHWTDVSESVMPLIDEGHPEHLLVLALLLACLRGSGEDGSDVYAEATQGLRDSGDGEKLEGLVRALTGRFQWHQLAAH